MSCVLCCCDRGCVSLERHTSTNRYTSKLMGTACDLSASDVTEGFRDSETGEWTLFNRPNAHATWGKSKHAVDDNNNTRQGTMNFLAGWPTKDALRRHLMLPFAIAEANAMQCWNYFHPEAKHTKRSWRRRLVTQLLNAEGGVNSRGGAYSADCELLKLEKGQSYDKRSRSMVIGKVKNYVSEVVILRIPR